MTREQKEQAIKETLTDSKEDTYRIIQRQFDLILKASGTTDKDRIEEMKRLKELTKKQIEVSLISLVHALRMISFDLPNPLLKK